MALTKEFAVIQGPPGTGKTYIGLKVDWNGLFSSCFLPLFKMSLRNHSRDVFRLQVHVWVNQKI